jgi:hypothetical protein
MAIFGAELSDEEAANAALDVATISFYVIKNLIIMTHDVGLPSLRARASVGLISPMVSRI